MKERIVFLDNLKCFAIFLVVLGHAIQYVDINGGGYNNALFSFIYSFHMPLFMAISGYFFTTSLKLRFVELAKKKMITLIVPALIWSIPKLIVSRGAAMDIIIYNVWFLKSLFLCYLIYYCFFRLLTPKFALLMITLIAMLVPLDFLPGNLNFMLPSFGFGIVLNKYRALYLQSSILIDILLLILYGIMFYFWDPFATTSIILIGGFDLTLFFTTIVFYLYKVVIAFVAILFLFRMFSKLSSTSQLVTYIGVNTLIIYLLNGVFSDVLMHISMPSMSTYVLYISIFFVTIVQFLMYIPFMRFCDRKPKLKKLLFMK